MFGFIEAIVAACVAAGAVFGIVHLVKEQMGPSW